MTRMGIGAVPCEGGTRDNDAVMGAGRSPVLAQAILAAVLRLTANLKGL